MNISSVIIKIQQGKENDILKKLKEYCEVHHIEGTTLVATIEQAIIDDEIRIFRAIEKVEGVNSVKMAFSYSEKELEEIKNHVELGEDVPKWLNDDSVTAKQINYQGDLKKKF